MRLGWPLRPASRTGLVLIILSTVPISAQERPDSGAFVTRIGNDTLSVERWRRSDGVVDVEAARRLPGVGVERYHLELNADYGISYYDATRWSGIDREAEASGRWVAEAQGTKLAFQRQQGEDVDNGLLDVELNVLPYLEWLYWPFELLLMRAAAAAEETFAQQMVSLDETFELFVTRTSPDQMTITLPDGGTMTARVDTQGRVQELNASGSTQPVTVTRERWLDVDAHARRFAELEAANGPLVIANDP